MKTPGMDQWCRWLDETTENQASGQMVSVDADTGEVEGYCCLGLGQHLIGDRVNLVNTAPAGRDRPIWNAKVGECQSLPDHRFIEFLGVDTEYTRAQAAHRADQEFHVYLDWPVGDEAYLERGWDSDLDEPLSDEQMENRIRIQMDYVAASLNDDLRLTFSQIADVVRYFGLRPEEGGS